MSKIFSPTDRADAITTARRWMTDNPLYLDTETTGLSFHDRIVEIAVVNAAGAPVYRHLVNPIISIPAEATAIHGITNEMVSGCPTFDMILQELYDGLCGSTVVIYNAAYDYRMIQQSIELTGVLRAIAAISDIIHPVCAMKLFAQFQGEWDNRHGQYKWHTLDKAMYLTHQPWPINEMPHRATADAKACRLVVMAMAMAVTSDAIDDNNGITWPPLMSDEEEDDLRRSEQEAKP